MTSQVTLDLVAPARSDISVVLPVYSETESVREVVGWLAEHLDSCLREIIIVLSPASDDRSAEMCRELERADPRVSVHVQQQNPGLGRAVREGIDRTRGNLVLLMDSDGEMENATVVRMLAEMNTGQYSLVVASRWCSGGGFVGYTRPKLVLNWCFQRLFRLLFWTRLHDLTYGFKLMRGELARGIAWQGSLHEIACETTLKPIRLGVPAAEVPSRWTARRNGQTKNRFFRNFRYVWMALRILVCGVKFESCPKPIAEQDESVAPKQLAS